MLDNLLSNVTYWLLDVIKWHSKKANGNCLFCKFWRYEHPQILAGQGSMGLEILDQVEHVEALIVPVGGGSLIAGVAFAVKSLHPRCQIIVRAWFCT